MHFGVKQKRIFSIAVALGVLASAYFIVLSSFFITQVVLPIVSTFTGVSIRAGYMKLDYINRRLSAKDLEIGNPDFPLVKARQAALTYDLGKLINYDVYLRDVEMYDGEISLILSKTGRWNYQDLLGIDNTWFSRPGEPDFHWDIKNVTGRNVNINIAIEQPQRRLDWRFPGTDIDLNAFGNNQATNLKISGGAAMTYGKQIRLYNGKFLLGYQAFFAENLIPYDMDLKFNVDYSDGTIGSVVAGGYASALNIKTIRDGELMKIEDLSFTGKARGQEESRIVIGGFFRFSPFGADLELQTCEIGGGILNLLCSGFLDFEPGHSRLSTTGDFIYRVDRDYVKSKFSLGMERRGAARMGDAALDLPDFKLNMQGDIEANLKKDELKLNFIDWVLQEEDGKGDVSFKLLHPVVLDCRDGVSGPQAKFELTANNLNLKLLHLLGFGQIRDGRLNGRINAGMDGGNRTIAGSGLLQAQDFALGELNPVDLQSRVVFSLDKHGRMLIPSWSLSADYEGIKLGQLSSSGEIWPFARRGGLKLQLEAFSNTAFWRVAGAPSWVENEKFPLKLNGTGAMDLIIEPDRAVFRNGSFVATQERQSSGIVEFRLPEIFYNYKYGLLNKTVAIPMKISGITGLWLNPYLSYAGLELDKGSVEGNVQLVVSNEVYPWRAFGDLRLADVSVKSYKNVPRPVECSIIFQAAMESPGNLDFDRLDLRVGVNGRDAMRCNLPMEIQTNTGAVAMELEISQLNELFLNLYLPDRFTQAKISGSAKMVLQPQHELINMDGLLVVDELVSQNPEKIALHGITRVNFTKSGDEWLLRPSNVRFFDEAGRSVADLNAYGEFNRKINQPGNPGELVFKATEFDFKLWYELFSGTALDEVMNDEDSSDTVVVREESWAFKDWGFDFGDADLRIKVDAENITFGPSNKILLKGLFYGHNKTIQSEKLSIRVNDCDVDTTLSLTGLDGGGIGFSSTALSRSGLDLNSWLVSLEGESGRDFTGRLESVAWQLNGVMRFDQGFWDDLSGNAEARFSKLTIPNELGRSLIGGVVLLPFTVASAFEAVTPGLGTGSIFNSSIYRSVEGFNRRMWRVNLNRGLVRLSSAGGVIAIDKFHFIGDLVRSFDFFGSMRLGSDPYLKLDSILDIGGVVFPSRITGTFDDPKLAVASSIPLTLWKNFTSLGGAIWRAGTWFWRDEVVTDEFE